MSDEWPPPDARHGLSSAGAPRADPDVLASEVNRFSGGATRSRRRSSTPIAVLLCLAALSISLLGLPLGFAIDNCNGHAGVISLTTTAGLIIVWMAGRLLVRQARHVGQRPPLLPMAIGAVTVFLLLWVLGAVLFVEMDCSS